MYSRSLLCTVLLLSSGVFGAEVEPWERPVKFGLDTYLALRHLGTELGSSIKPTSSDRTNYLDAAQELGVTVIRDDLLSWDEIQPEKDGPYDFSFLDDLVRKSSARGIDVLSMVYFLPPWATVGENHPWSYPHDPRYKLPMRKSEASFRRFLHAAVERYCGCGPASLVLKIPVRSYVFMNEPEGYANEILTPDEYAHWLRIFSEEIRAVDPGIRVVAPALAAPGAWDGNYLRGQFLDRLLDSKELRGPGWPYFDVVDYHPYPVGYGPEHDLYGIDVATSYVRGVLARHGLSMPLWITELGDNSTDEAVQADHVVEYAIHAATQGVERVYIFGMADYGKERWGLLEDTPSEQPPVRKPSFVAYKTLLAKISDNQRVEFLGPGRYCVFRNGKPPVYVLWSTGETASVQYFLRGALSVTDLTGHTKIIEAEHLALDKHPILVELETDPGHGVSDTRVQK